MSGLHKWPAARLRVCTKHYTAHVTIWCCVIITLANEGIYVPPTTVSMLKVQGQPAVQLTLMACV
jgi:hypothetical protein